MNKKLQTIKYLVSDFLASSIAWTLFFIFRKLVIEAKLIGISQLHFDYNFFLGITIIPLFWIIIYHIVGFYSSIYRRSRLKELFTTFIITLAGIIIIFFKLILDDYISSYQDYYISISFLFSVQFFLIYIPRLIITSSTIKKIHSGKIGFPTILVGCNGKITEMYHQISDMKSKLANHLVGYIDINNEDNTSLTKDLKRLGDFEDLHEIIIQNNIEEVIIAIESSEHEKIKKILKKLILTDVIIKIIPSSYDLIAGYVKLDTLYPTLLITIQNRPMTYSLENTKRIIDILFSLIAIILLLPVYIITAILVKLTSKGSFFYRQERIGRYGKPFKIIKFRSMYSDAEKNGPALSSDNDPRVTPFGRFMRKTRLDEIPQFFNVLFGQMSLVGPRPERKYYIDQIVKKAPFYLNLLKIKPGITSLGQVKFGYAQNVDEMIERMKYDLSYLYNISLYLDFKIMILTVKTIFEASGK